MTSQSDQTDQLDQIRTVPEFILKGIIRMDDPTEEKIRRNLPVQYKDLAGVIYDRLISHSDDSEASSSADDETINVEARSTVADKSPQVAPSGAPRFGATPGSAVGGAPEDVEAAAEDGDTTPAAEEPEAETPVEPDSGSDSVASAFADFLNNKDDAASVMDRSKIIEGLTTERFADYEFGNEGSGEDTVKVRYQEFGETPKVEVTWDRPDWVEDDDITVYRVVASDGESDQSPEAGELMVSISSEGYEEDVPSGIAFRHYQVWMNVGRTPREAVISQPHLIGEDICIFPISGVNLEVSQGVVEGSWEVIPGYKEVRVYGSRKGDRGRADSPQNRLVDGVTYKNFEHRAVPGTTMRYVVIPVVTFRDEDRVGTRGKVYEIAVPATLSKTELESCTHGRDPRDGSERIYLSWFAPRAGVVRVYLTNRSLEADLSFKPVPIEAVERDGAVVDSRQIEEEMAPDSQVDKSPMWPDDWDEVHVTPVTIVDGMAEVGSAKVLQRVSQIKRASLIERTADQLITFEWPLGASMVKIETSSLGTDDRSFRQQRTEIDEDQYRGSGGVRLKLNPLGEKVILTPRSIYRGIETAAEETVLEYRGIRHYQYGLQATPEGLIIHLWSVGREDQKPPRFQLVYHPERFPLCIEDQQDPNAGVAKVRPLRVDPSVPGDGLGVLIAPSSLPEGPFKPDQPTPPGHQPWIVPIDEVRRIGAQPQNLRLFIVDESNDDVSQPGVVRTRKIVTDDAAGQLLKLDLRG